MSGPEWPAGFVSRKVQTADGVFRLWSGGEGPALWCLHGFPDSPQTWIEIAPMLAAAGYQVFVPEMPGYALDHRVVDYRLQALAQVLGRLMDAVSGEQALRLIGHDWGAALNYALAAQRPQQIAAMVCAAVPHPRRFLRPSAAQLRRSWYMAYFQLPRLPERSIRARNFKFIEKLWRTWSPSWAFSEAALDPVRQALAQPPVLAAVLAYYRALPAGVRQAAGSAASVSPLQACKVPTLAVAGLEDGCIGAEMFQKQEDLFAERYRLLAMADAGHFMHREQPRGFVTAAVEFLA